MSRIPTPVLYAALGLAALGASNLASAGAHVGIGLPLVVPTAVVVARPALIPAPAVVTVPSPVVITRPLVVAYPPVGYYGFPVTAYPRVVVGWRPGYVVRGGHHWHR